MLIIIILSVVILFASSCIGEVDVEPMKERIVCVKCILTDDLTQKVELLWSSGYGENSFLPVENADVVILDYSRNTKIRMSPRGGGLYEGDFTPRAGDRYDLKVAIKGRDTIKASTFFPVNYEIETSFFVDSVWFKSQWPGDNFYTLHPHDTLPNCYPYAFDWNAYRVIKEQGFTSMHHSMPGMLFRFRGDDTLRMWIMGEMSYQDGSVSVIENLATNHRCADDFNLTGKYFDNERWYHLSDRIQDSLDYEMALHYTNLPLHNAYIRICTVPDEYDNGLEDVVDLSNAIGESAEEVTMDKDAGKYFVIMGDFSYNCWTNYRKTPKPSLYFCSVSAEYDKYLKDAVRLLSVTDSNLASILYTNGKECYTNIKGGFGIFGAMSVRSHNCDLKLYQGVPIPHHETEVYSTYHPYKTSLKEI